MAEIAAVFAASHTPVMTNLRDAPGPALRDAVLAEFERVGDEIDAIGPDAVVLVSDDHLHNFFLDNFPSFCLGIAPAYPSPLEGWLKIEKQVLPGQPELAAHLLGGLMDASFDPAFSMELTLDHGMMTPLDLAGIAGKHPIVPILVNAVQPPLPGMRRCVELGRALRHAIQRYEDAARVVVLATGGLSHDVGTPRMGALNEDFDRAFLAHLEAGGDTAAADYATENVNTAGNGAEEVRNWLVAHGVAGCEGYSTSYYEPIEAWYTGIGIGRWTPPA